MGESKDKIKLLYVDDEAHNLTSLKATFRKQFEVHIAESGAEGLEIVKKEDLHIILTDQRMPNMTGIEFLEQVQTIRPEPIRILITGYTDINAVVDAINKGQVYRYLTKPWNEDDLKATLLAAYEVFALRRDNKILIERLARANDQLEFLLRQRLLS
jgi:response regulator RpfG family c-di-GMP phosphodiesterase